MVVEHMVWFRFRGDIAEARRSQLADRLRALRTQVPGILRLEAGDNFTERAQGCQLGLIVTLQSREALAAYQVHPDHVAVAKELRADCEEILAFDFEHP